jgi:predicted transcriptional regulator
MDKTLPIEKKDIQYNPETQEVTLQREKFDNLMRFVRDVMKELDQVEEERDIAQYQSRRSEAAENVYKTLIDDMELASSAISKWVDSHSIQELAKRSGIPYATCHRIVEGRLKHGSVSMNVFKKLLQATKIGIEEMTTAIPVRSALVGTVCSSAEPVVKNVAGVEIQYMKAGSGAFVRAAKEKQHDIVILDISLPQFKLSEVAKVIDAAKDSPVLVVNSVSKATLEQSAQNVLAVAAGASAEI